MVESERLTFLHYPIPSQFLAIHPLDIIVLGQINMECLTLTT